MLYLERGFFASGRRRGDPFELLEDGIKLMTHAVQDAKQSDVQIIQDYSVIDTSYNC